MWQFTRGYTAKWLYDARKKKLSLIGGEKLDLWEDENLEY
jgi:hypothetical protein